MNRLVSLTAKQEFDRISKALALGLRAGGACSFHRRLHRGMELDRDEFLLAFLARFEQPLPARPAR